MSITIKLARIDKRLLHATVAVNWNQFIDVNNVLIVDPNHTKDPFIADVMQLCLPKTMRVKIFNVPEFIEYINKDSKSNKKVMIIFVDLKTTCEAVKSGFRTKEIQMPYPASRMMIKNLSDYFNDEEIEQIRYMQDQDIKVFFQTAPFDNKDYTTFLK